MEEILEFKYKDINIRSKILFKNRKSITIKINIKGEITVLCPKSISKLEVKNILYSKSEWILKKLLEISKYDYFNRNYINDEKFLYLGKEYKLKIIESKIDEVLLQGEHLIVKSIKIDVENIKNLVAWWYKRESQKIIIDRISFLKQNCLVMSSLNAKSVKVKEQNKRWGSCTSNKDIYINSKIAMARISAIDYIIIHEFCHLVYMNHSKEFYNLVEKIMPNYKDEVNWLKENSHKIKLK